MSGVLGEGQLGDFLLGDGGEESGGTTYYAFAQAQAFIIFTRSVHGQAQGRITGIPTKSGQALAIILPRRGFLARVTIGGNGYGGTFIGSYWEISPSNPNYHNGGPHPPVVDNDFWGIRWDTQYWEADVTGTWRFATSSDDGSFIRIYDESNTLIGGPENNYNGPQPNTYVSANVSLTAGTKYRIQMEWGNGESGWEVHGYYRRPADGSDNFLTNGSPPWMTAIYQSYGQAQAEIVGDDRFVFAQSQASILQAYNKHGQAQARILQVYNFFAQAQGLVQNVYNGYAQAQATILGWAFAQAQSDIKQIYQGYAQAQSVILQTYNGYGQAQTSIGQIGRTYAQAQGTILQVYNVFAQAQGDILQTYQGYAQAQCVVKQTYQGYAQAQGSILQTYQSYAQAQGTVLQTYNSFAQAQSDILQTYQSYSQAQGNITKVEQGYAQAQGSISITGRVYGQARATILGTGLKFAVAKGRIRQFDIERFAQARSKIVVSPQQYGQAQAFIFRVESGNAQALINSIHKNAHGQAKAFLSCTTDTFTRTTSFGLGSDYTWQDWDTSYNNASESLHRVDGTRVVIPVGEFDSYSINATVPLAGTVQFDFYVPPTGNQTHSNRWHRPTYGVRFGPDYNNYSHGLYVGATNPSGWRIGNEVDNSIGVTFFPDPDNMYTAKMRYDNLGNEAFKVWKTSDPEPESYLLTTALSAPDFESFNTAWIDFYNYAFGSAGGIDTYFDNLSFCIPYIFTSQVTGQAQAFISTSVSSGQAQGRVLQVYNNYAQAQAAINAGWGIGLAQAFIIPSRAYAQAKALIELSLPFIDRFDDRYTVDPDVLGLGDRPYLWPGPNGTFGGVTLRKVAYVDGETIIMPPSGETLFGNVLLNTGTNPGGGKDSYWIPIRRMPEKGFFQFDFNVGSGPRSDALPSFNIRGKTAKNDRIMEFLLYYISGNPNASWRIGSNFGSTLTSVGLADNTWYRVLMTWNEAANPAFTIRVWNRDTQTEGTAFIVQTGTMFGTENNALWSIAFTGSTSGDFYIDNLILGRIYPTGNAQARIKKVADKKYGQAQALINARFGLGQARAQVTGAPYKVAQAQAQVNFWLGVGQAQATIINGAQSGQAQAFVGHFQFAQAQAQINIKWQFGLAQAQITMTWRFGQAQAFLRLGLAWGQAQAFIAIRRQIYGQANAYISIKRWIWGQAQGYIRPTVGFGQAQAYISSVRATGNALALIVRSFVGYGQALAQIGALVVGQAQGYIISDQTIKCGQAQGYIGVCGQRFGQAQGLIQGFKINPAQAQARIGYQFKRVGQAQAYLGGKFTNFGQAQAQINTSIIYSGQAQAFIARTIGYGNAQAFIFRTEPGGLVQFNRYVLPGYLQSEELSSPMRINWFDPPHGEPSSEYLGLENKIISLRLLVIQGTYQLSKEKVLLAGSLVRSSRDEFTRLTVIDTTKYYLAKPRNIKLTQQAGLKENAAEYTVDFEVKPWRYGDTLHSLTGTTLLDTDSVGRTIGNGTWTPATIIVTGNNVTVSGYTEAGEFTGYVSVSGAVNDMTLDSENYTVTMAGENRNDLLNTIDHKIMVGPGRTLFAVTGATSCEIIYQDRWPL